DPGPAVLQQLGGQLRPRGDALGGLDQGDHVVAPLLVGRADDGDVGDRGVFEQGGLDLGGVDVDAAGDDQVGAPVAEEQEAVLVQVADVAGGVPLAAHAGRGLGGVLAVLEPAEAGLDVDQAGLARGQLVPRLVEDLGLEGGRGPADGAGPGQPVVRFDGEGDGGLGGAVVLVEHRPPPVHDPLFDGDGAGGGGVDDLPEAGQVVAPPDLLGQLQHP